MSSVSSTVDQWLRKLVVWSFQAAVIAVPLIFTWINEELFEFNKMILVYGLTVVIVCAWIARMVIHKTWLWVTTPFDIPIMIWVTSQVLATIFSIHPYTSFFGYYTRFHGGLLSTLCYVLLYYAFVANMQKREVWTWLTTALVTGAIVSLYGISEHFGHSPSCWLITGGADGGVGCWLQDVQTRVFATFGQPNWLAAYVIMLLPVTWIVMLHSLSSWPKTWHNPVRWLMAISSSLLFAVLLYTKSRSGLLGFGVGAAGFTLGYILLLARTQPKKGLTASLVPLATTVVIGVVLLAVTGSPFTPSLSSKLATPEPAPLSDETTPVVNRLDLGGTDSGEIRKIVWEGAFRVWQRYPLFGSGVETFAYSYYRDRPVSHNLVSEWDFLYNKAHNEFLNLLATTGIVGLGAAVVWLIWIGSAFAWSWLSDEYDHALWGLGLTTGLVALSISNFFGFSTVMVALLQALWPAVWLVMTDRQTKAAELPQALKHTPVSGGQWLSLSGVALAGLYGLWVINSFWRADAAYASSKGWLQQGAYLESLTSLQTAINLAPREALYYELLGSIYGQATESIAQTDQATAAAQLAEQAIYAGERSIELNPVHLNFYRSQAKTYLHLAAINPAYYQSAYDTLAQAQELAPTEPKIMYNRALLAWELKKLPEAEELFKTTIEMKTNYEAARMSYAQFLQEQQQPLAAIEQYEYILEHIQPNNQVAKDTIVQLKTKIADETDVRP